MDTSLPLFLSCSVSPRVGHVIVRNRILRKPLPVRISDEVSETQSVCLREKIQAWIAIRGETESIGLEDNVRSPKRPSQESLLEVAQSKGCAQEFGVESARFFVTIFFFFYRRETRVALAIMIEANGVENKVMRPTCLQ